MASRSNLEQFIEKARLIHGDKYDYSEFIYKNNATKGKIICNICNKSSEQTPNCHLASRKISCDCIRLKKLTHNLKSFIEKSSKIHNNLYDYSLCNYTGYKNKVEIICKEHGIFKQNPRDHFEGHGCPKCVVFGYKKEDFIKKCKDNIATLYVIRCWNSNEEFYKIGITTKTTKERFNTSLKMPYQYEEMFEISIFSDLIWDYEKDFHSKYKKFKYKPKIKFSGRYECFSIEIEESIFKDFKITY